MPVGRTDKYPTKVSHLQTGEFYAVDGQARNIDLLPAQVFHLKALNYTHTEGRTVLEGTLYVRIWVRGIVVEQREDNYGAVAHMLGLSEPGTNLTGQHDFHLRKLETRKEFEDMLGTGIAYQDFLQQQAVDDPRPGLVVGNPLGA